MQNSRKKTKIESQIQIKSLKIIEYIASGAAIISLLTYFSGYQIFSSFFHEQFGQTFFLGSLFPPSIFTFIGFILVFNILVSLPFFYFWVIGNLDIKNLEETDYIATIILFIITVPIFKVIFHFFKKITSLPDYLLIIGIIILTIIMGYFSWKLAIKFIKKYKMKNKLFKIIDNFFHPSTGFKFGFVLILPILYPSVIISVSNLINKITTITPKMSEVSLLSMFSTFYIIFAFSLALFISAIKIIKDIKLKYEYEWLKILLITSCLLSFVYGMSTLMGTAISESYKKDNKGVFPCADLVLTENLQIPQIKKIEDRYEVNIFLITKDNNFYYGFNSMEKSFLMIPLDKVKSIKIKGK